jgi:predicted nuclease of restriction endonuclease-like (RecB) superfamily
MSNPCNHFVASSFSKDDEYMQWLRQIKEQYRRSQAKAAVRVNDAMIEFYWFLGHEIVDLKAESRWGDGVVKQLSLDLRESFPGARGFSTTNLWYIKQWYTFYSPSNDELSRLVAKIKAVAKLPQVVGQSLLGGKLPQGVGELNYPIAFGLLGWGHHRVITTKCKTIDEAAFYIAKAIEGNWSRRTLEGFIDSDLYHAQGSLPSNFDKTLPEEYRMKVSDMFKDPYDFGFLKMPQVYQERDLEDALTHHITRFLLELGKGFTFYGRQVELVVSGTSYFIDMLFYHVRLKCFVVVELKVTDFKPEYVGKLNFYVTAVDKLLKQDDDKPTIGLLICRSKDNTKVEWSFDGLNKPIGVAAYDLQQFLPSAEEMEQQIKLMEEE